MVKFSAASKSFSRSFSRNANLYFIFPVTSGAVGLLPGKMWDPPTVRACPAAAVLLSNLGDDRSQGI